MEAKWLKEGDKCTKNFHQMANSHRRINAIEVIQDGENMLSDQEAIKEHAVNFYEKLFKEEYCGDQS